MIKLLLNWLGIFRLENVDLALENLALLHQLLVLERKGTKPKALPIWRNRSSLSNWTRVTSIPRGFQGMGSDCF